MMKHPIAPLKQKAGFSLVEVVLALGVVAFAFVSTIGLLPLGLNVSQQAIDTTVVSHIYQEMSTQALQTDFSRLEELDGVPLYYDYQGKTVEPADSIYKAVYKVNPATHFPQAQTGSDKLATVSISILPTRGVNVAAAEPDESDASQKFNILISDNGL